MLKFVLQNAMFKTGNHSTLFPTFATGVGMAAFMVFTVHTNQVSATTLSSTTTTAFTTTTR